MRGRGCYDYNGCVAEVAMTTMAVAMTMTTTMTVAGPDAWVVWCPSRERKGCDIRDELTLFYIS